MKLRKPGIFLVLLGTIAAYGMGCEPYHRGGVGVDVDIHSKDSHRDDGDHHDDNH